MQLHGYESHADLVMHYKLEGINVFNKRDLSIKNKE